MSPQPQTEAQADGSAETKTRILEAAIKELAENGLAGAAPNR